MSTTTFCTQCGESLRAGARFCESCGSSVEEDGAASTASSEALAENSSAVPPIPELPVNANVPASFGAASVSRWGGERPVGQMPCAWQTGKKGLFGGAKTRQGNLVITDRRILFIHETSESNGEEMWEDERVNEEAERMGVSLKEYVRAYDWFGGPGMRFLKTSPDELMAENGKNWELPLSRITRAHVLLSDEDGPDQVVLEVAGEAPRRFNAFRASGEIALTWLTHVLGSDRISSADHDELSE